MLTRQDKNQFRGTIFTHLDGLVTAPTAWVLHSRGVLDYLLKNQAVNLKDMTREFAANEGYLNVALRVLCSQGWLDQKISHESGKVLFSSNENSKKAFELCSIYEQAVDFLKYAVRFPEEQIGPDSFRALDKIFKAFENSFGIQDKGDAVSKQIHDHMEGVIAAPIIVLLGMKGFFHKYFMEASFRAQEYHRDPESFRKILDFLSHLGWFEKKNDTYKFKPKGLFFAQRAAAYGVTVSYLPTLINLDELIFGDPLLLQGKTEDENERHVNREMNVWGSGGAHSTYFKVIDKIIIDLFNKPIDEQPKGILDMGCGNGAFLQHAYEVIENQTHRGELLDEYPLFLVGVDFNQAALKVTRANLIKADIWAKVIWGDIGRPEQLARDLLEDYDIALQDLLNVRTFLDHNRIWEQPLNPTGRKSKSTGAFAFKGRRLQNAAVEDSLLEHFQKWKPYIEKFGLMIIELHTLDPAITAANIRRTPATAYDATHGYSDQYILEIDVFRNLIHEVGLISDETYFRKFPDNELANISIHLLKGNP